jgi:hypothetical protein
MALLQGVLVKCNWLKGVLVALAWLQGVLVALCVGSMSAAERWLGESSHHVVLQV